MDSRAVTTLRRIAAELSSELGHIDRTVSEVIALPGDVASSKVTLYATAALLDTFYTGIEKALRRIANELGGVPEGSGWHRTLLDDMALDIPKVRPPVLTADTVLALGRFLAFRHRFRNLYLFDLQAAPIAALVDDLPSTWDDARRELQNFAVLLERMADAIG